VEPVFRFLTDILTAISMTNTTFFIDPHSSLDPPEQPLKRYDSICTETFAHQLAALPTQVLLQLPPLFAQ
jgi:hypothetical protein